MEVELCIQQKHFQNTIVKQEHSHKYYRWRNG